MRSITFSLSCLLAFQVIAYGQDDPAAIKVLDAFSARSSSAPSISMKFNIVTVNQAEMTSDTLSGSVLISKDRYRLTLPDNIVFFNGIASWSYLPAEKEVTITKADRKDESFQNKPSAIFSMYKKGYKCRLVEEKQSFYIIDLYPEDLNTELIRVRLNIKKPGLELASLDYKRKDGTISTLHVKAFDLKQKPAPEDFQFRKEKYPGVEVIDMR